MKKLMRMKCFSLLLIPILLLVIWIPAATVHAEESDTYVNDVAGLLSDSDWNSLEAKAKRISENYHCNVYVVTVPDYQEYGVTMEDACNTIFQEYLPGYGSGRDAIVLLLSMAERDYWIDDFGEYGSKALTDYGRETLESVMKPGFRENNWTKGFSDYLDQCTVILKAAKNGKPLKQAVTGRILKAYGIALVIGVIAALIVCGSFKAKMKTAVKATSAAQYVAPMGVRIRVRDDQYIDTTRTERTIERSSGGGSSNSGGGGKF